MMVVVVLAASRSWAQADAVSVPTSRPCASSGGAVLRMPGNIQVADDLRRPIDTMLRQSATFRSQCRQIARARQLYVRVSIDSRIVEGPYRARSTIYRLASGAIVAAIDIGAFGNPTEWLAHEFEHLLEQIEGVELRDLVRRRHGAWYSTDGMIETERAIALGRRVKDEVRGLARFDARLSPPPEDPERGDD